MKSLHVLFHMVKADFLERVRRYSFLLVLAFAVYLGYEAGTGGIVLRLDTYQGVLNSAWCGSMMTLVSAMFLSLVGFYIVKNSLLRDEQTRVGRILAATPMSKSFYTLAKTLSNFAVLTAMMAVLAVAAIALQLVQGQYAIQIWTLLAPFIWVGLPAALFTSAIAVLFETLPVLRGGVGNVIYFFAWCGFLGAGVSHHLDDLGGFTIIGGSMQNALKRVYPTYNNDIQLTISDKLVTIKRFLWIGVDWTPSIVLHRLWWVAGAAGVAILAAAFFHRFDPAREGWRWKKKTKIPTQNPTEDFQGVPAPAAVQTSAAHLTPLLRSADQARFVALVVSELRLMLKGQRWWWYVVAAGLFIACLASPLNASRGGVIVVAWLWPVLLWSQMGTREARYSTQSLLFSSSHALQRQLPAAWAAGVMVAMITGGGLGIRLLLAGDSQGLAAWTTACLFIPTLALALGAWSGSSKAFEALYAAWWYVGPAHHTPGLDFMGTANTSSRPGMYLLFTGALLAAAYLGRRSKMAYA
jgi:hypothetical protein